MILFLYTFNFNRARTSGKFYEELLTRCDNKNLKMLDCSGISIIELKKQLEAPELIVFDNSIILSMGQVQLLSKNFYTQKISKEFYYEIWNLVDKSGKPVFLMHPSSDLHAINFGLERVFYLDFIKRITGIFWPYHKCPLERENVNDRYPFTTLERYHLKKDEVINIWEEIKANVPISIDFPHCIPYANMERKARKKKWEIIIPGVSYKTRQIAQESAVKADLFVAPYTHYSRWFVYAPYLIYDKLTPRKLSTPLYHANSFRLYRYMISRSSVSFACGSELKYFVRKFIEIPAFRSAMIAFPSANFQEYGFEDGVHYLNAYPEEVGEKAKYLLKNNEFAEKLIQNAWNLVATQHTATERVNQVLNCLTAYLQGKLKNAGYQNGKFEIFS